MRILFVNRVKNIMECTKIFTYVPTTPAGTFLFDLAADTEEKAWENLLKDAAHMPYKGIEGFKMRGYELSKLEK